MRKIISRLIVLSLIALTSAQVLAKPTVTTGLITWRANKADFGIKFLVNGQWTYTHDKGQANSASKIIGQIQGAGVDAIYHDLTNWQSTQINRHGPNVWAASADELPVVSAEIKRRGMKHFMMMRAQTTDTGSAANYYTSIARANWQASQIWNYYAQEEHYFKINGKPVIKIFEPKHTEFWAAYNRAPASEKTYLSRFTLITEEGDSTAPIDSKFRLGLNGALNVSKYREIYPHHQDTVGHWLTYRKKDTGAQWENKVSWAMDATDIADLGWFDESSDGSSWAISDATDAINGNCPTPRPANKYPSTDWWIYYNAVQAHCLDTFNIRSVNSGYVLSVEGNRTSAGIPVEQRGFAETHAWKFWKLEDVGSGYYKIVNMNSGLVLSAEGATHLASGDPVEQRGWSASHDWKKWKLIPLGNEQYRIQNKYSGLSLSVEGNHVSAGSPLQVRVWNSGHNWKKFTLDWLSTP